LRDAAFVVFRPRFVALGRFRSRKRGPSPVNRLLMFCRTHRDDDGDRIPFSSFACRRVQSVQASRWAMKRAKELDLLFDLRGGKEGCQRLSGYVFEDQKSSPSLSRRRASAPRWDGECTPRGAPRRRSSLLALHRRPCAVKTLDATVRPESCRPVDGARYTVPCRRASSQNRVPLEDDRKSHFDIATD